MLCLLLPDVGRFSARSILVIPPIVIFAQQKRTAIWSKRVSFMVVVGIVCTQQQSQQLVSVNLQ